MKKIIAIALLGVMATSALTYGQTAEYPVQTPKVVMSGNFNSEKPGQGTKVAGDMAERVWPLNMNVLYTKKDTVSNTATDTLSCVLKTEVNSVYTWVHATGISGTNTSCTVKLCASGDNQYGSDYAVLYTATVSATNPVGSYVINSGNKWPYTKYWWVFTGVGTHSTSWYGGMCWR